MAIFSCKGCTPPERHPGCHGTCQKYLEEKARYEAQKEEEYKKRNLTNAIMDQRGRAVRRAMQHRRKGKYGEQ